MTYNALYDIRLLHHRPLAQSRMPKTEYFIIHVYHELEAVKLKAQR